MTESKWWFKRDLAAYRGVEVASISRDLSRSRVRLRAGLPLRETDLPVPADEDRIVGVVRWRMTPELRVWLDRPRHGSRTTPTQTQTTSTRKDET